MDRKLEQAAWDDLVWGDIVPEEAACPEPEVSSPPVVVAVAKAEDSQPSVRPQTAPSVPAPVVEPMVPPTTENDDDDFEPPPPPAMDGGRLKPAPEPQAAAAVARVGAANLPGTKPLPMNSGTVAQLTVTLADGSKREVTVSGEVFTVGRRSENDLAIKDRHVSGEHARLVLRPDGAYDLEDLGSSGGTLVNDFEIDTPTRLASGDMIEFATVRADFKYLSGPPVEDDMEFGSTLPHTRKKAAAAPAKAALTPAPVSKQPKLTIAMPDGSSLVVEIAGQMSIGRLETNDIVIPQDNVSSQHARLICHPGGIVELIDLNSTCGTFVNDKPIEQKSLGGGEKLRFGVVEAMFETPASLAKAAAAASALPAATSAPPTPPKPQTEPSPLPMPKRPQGWQ